LQHLRTGRKLAAQKTIVIDFKATGVVPGYDDHVIESGVLMLRGWEIVDCLYDLMNHGNRT